jgi:hypothetical protein
VQHAAVAVRFRRLAVRYERRADIHTVFLVLACAPVCWRTVQRELG